jgi:hypothetical protein
MRVALAVPYHREFLRGDTPSEPLLAEAGAWLLNDGIDFETKAPNLLAELLGKGLLARGERGEMVGRLLWTMAHDRVIRTSDTRDQSIPGQPVYHKPIRFLDWLKALINPRWHTVVLNAKPIADPNGQTLEDAFKDAYLNFSHFARAGDSGIISPDRQWITLVRGMCYQCVDNQRSTDLFGTIHHGGLGAPISQQNSSSLHGQIRNRTVVTDVLANPHVGGTPVNNLPIMVLVQDVGIQQNKVYPHESIPAKKLRGTNRTENIHMRHYQIHIEGCASETYGVVPEPTNNVYKSILGATKVIDDFPRNDLEEHRQALMRLKPAFFSKLDEKASLGWISDDLDAANAVRSSHASASSTVMLSTSIPSTQVQITSAQEASSSGEVSKVVALPSNVTESGDKLDGKKKAKKGGKKKAKK